MRRLNCFTPLLMAVSMSRLVVAGADESGPGGSTTEPNSESQCSLYLAISSTSTEDSTVWGIYAGKDYEPGETVGVPELVINTHNLRFNVVDPTAAPLPASITRSLGFLEENFWVGETMGAKFELDGGRSIALVSGSGSLGAGNAKRSNANWHHPSVYQRKPIGERRGEPHASRGAISPLYGATLKTTSSVKAGSEIFVNYGDTFDEKDAEEELNTDDYSRLDETVNQMIQFFKKHEAELDNDSKREIYNFITKDVMSAAVGPVKAQMISGVLPRTPDELAEITAAGGVAEFSKPSSSRPTDWLQNHGLCMDNLVAGASTIPNAGRGAFAARPIKQGKLVVPVPVLQIPDKSILNMYPLDEDDDGEFLRVNNTVVGTQLLMNYCFGHPESTMLLAPTGSNAGLINHSDKPNAKVVWSKHPSHEKHWTELPPEKLASPDNTYVGLLLEIEALRDIAQGEEVFIDYGKEWKDAWTEHEKKWQARLASGDLPKIWPLRALDLNEEYADKPFLTKEEEKARPYPKNVGLAAFLVLKEDGASGTSKQPRTWAAPPSGQSFSWESLATIDFVESVTPSNGSYLYTIRWTTDDDAEMYVKDVPHSAFTFVDAPESSDQFTADPFRHYIGLPDDVFPQGPWRNLKK